MGNYKFRLADMLPNAWFYKLKDSSRTRNHTKNHQQTPALSSSATGAPPLTHQRKSYYFTRDKIAPPMKSSKKIHNIKRNTNFNRQSPKLVTSSVSAGCSCRATLESVWTKSDSSPNGCPNSPFDSSSEHESLLPQNASDHALIPETFDGELSWSASCQCGIHHEFVIDIENKPLNTKTDDPGKHNQFDTVLEFDLPPIITKPKNEANESTKINRNSAKFIEKKALIKDEIVKACSKEQKLNHVRRSSFHSPGVKLRTNSPRIGSRRLHGRKSVSFSSSLSSRKDLSESYAVVKSSKDPQKDFKESMLEMIVENNIFASKDLEDLLACYLSLNSDVYHDLIIKVFKQIWFDIIDSPLS